MESKDFLHDFVDIIKNCNYDNTYKMAWAKSLVEIALESDLDAFDKARRIDFEEIAEKVVKYYWNHTFFFDLKQGSNSNKPPQILTRTKELIGSYKETQSAGTNPVRFERAHATLKKHPFHEKTIQRVIKILKIDVSHRFLCLRNETFDHIYDYNKGDEHLMMPKDNPRTLKDYAFMLFDIINFRWSLILETFNSSPESPKRSNSMTRIRSVEAHSINIISTWSWTTRRNGVSYAVNPLTGKLRSIMSFPRPTCTPMTSGIWS